MKVNLNLLLTALNDIRKPQSREQYSVTFAIMVSGNCLTLVKFKRGGCTVVKKITCTSEPDDIENVYFTTDENAMRDYLTTLKCEEIRMCISYNAITISADKSRFSIESKSDYHDIITSKISDIDFANEKRFVITDTHDFLARLDRTTNFIEKNDFDKFNTVFFSPYEKVIYATDGFRLHKSTMNDNSVGKNEYELYEYIVIYYEFIPALTGLFSNNTSLVCSSSSGSVVFKSSDGLEYTEAIYLNNIDAQNIPPFHNILGMNPQAHITVNTKEFREAIKKAKIVEIGTSKINILATRKKLVVYSEGTGSFITAMDAEISEDDYNFFFKNSWNTDPAFVVLVNSKYITDALPTGEKVTFGFAGQTKNAYSIVINDASETNIVMPIRVLDYPLKAEEREVYFKELEEAA